MAALSGGITLFLCAHVYRQSEDCENIQIFVDFLRYHIWLSVALYMHVFFLTFFVWFSFRNDILHLCKDSRTVESCSSANVSASASVPVSASVKRRSSSVHETDSSTILKCSTLLARAHWAWAIYHPVIFGTHNDRDFYFDIVNHEWGLIMFNQKRIQVKWCLPAVECTRSDGTSSWGRRTARTVPGCSQWQSHRTWEEKLSTSSLSRRVIKTRPWDCSVLPAHPLHLQLALVDDLLQADRVPVTNLGITRG